MSFSHVHTLLFVPDNGKIINVFQCQYDITSIPEKAYWHGKRFFFLQLDSQSLSVPTMLQETLCSVACPKMNILLPQSMREVEVGAGNTGCDKNVTGCTHFIACYTRQRSAQLCFAESLNILIIRKRRWILSIQ